MSGHRRSTVPVLTDVLQIHGDDAPAIAAPMQEAALAPLNERWPAPGRSLLGAEPSDPSAKPGVPTSPSAARLADDALVEKVLEDVQRQVDLRIEHQLNAALAPVIEKLTSTLAADARVAIAESLREVVQRAVAQELDRIRAVD